MGAGLVGGWTMLAAIGLFVGWCPAVGSAHDSGTELRSAAAKPARDAPSTVTLESGRAYYFSKYKGDVSELLELNADGNYRLLDRGHYGVKETDRGRWKLGDSTGEVTMESARYYETVRAGVLSINLITTSTIDNLTSYSLALTDVMTSVAMNSGLISVQDYVTVMRRNPVRISDVPGVDSKRAYGPKEQAILTAGEVEAFSGAVNAALRAPTPSVETLTLRKYNGVTFIDVPDSTRYPWAGMSYYGGETAAIDKRDKSGRIYETFIQAPHEYYIRAVTTTQPWLFVPDLETTAAAKAMARREREAAWADPGVAPIAALKGVVRDLRVDSKPTTSTNEVAGVYSSTGPTSRARTGGGLSGRLMYLFPDGEYLYLEWADIYPPTILSRGAWRLDHGYVVFKDDGVLQPKYKRLDDHAFLPVSFGIDGMRPAGLLGFPEAYERIFRQLNPEPYHILFRLLERTEGLEQLGDWRAKKEELMQKHWRPDWVAGVEDAASPEW